MSIVSSSPQLNITDFKDITDPSYVGPGSWNIIHRISFKARTRESQINFIELMKEICQGFPCTICRGHCVEYIKNHPLEEYVGVTMEINKELINLGMFIWSWKFHNVVNKRLNKPFMSWDTAYNFYSNSDSVCSTACMNTNHTPEPEKISDNSIKISLPSNIINIPEPNIKNFNQNFRSFK